MQEKEERAQGRAGVWLHFRVTPEVHEAIKAMADQERRSISQMALLVLEDGLRTRGVVPTNG